MKCTINEQETCQTEKMGCIGCAYNTMNKDELIKELVEIENRLTELSKQYHLNYYITTHKQISDDSINYDKVSINAFVELR